MAVDKVMKAFFIRFFIMVMLAGALLSPLKGVSFAGAPLPPAVAAADAAAMVAHLPAEDGFVPVPSAVPCLVAIAALAVQYENGSSGGAEPVPVPAGRLTGVDVNPSHGPPIAS
jgi:hypothetical protein